VDIEIVTLSRQGGRPYNEDVFGQWKDERFVACLVADGAGGHGGGDVAAEIACASVLHGFAAAPGLESGRLRHLVEQANRDVVARQAEGGRLAAMRSTLVLAAVDLHANELAWTHTGDSRAYLFRDGALMTRTVDHSLVQQMVSSGLIDEERARQHPRRNLLLSALGAPDGELDVDACERMPLVAGDVVLLCSDGVWEVLGDVRLTETLRDSRDPDQWIGKIDAEVRSRAAPGHDNYTAVAMWLHAGELVTQPMA
jgi:serine/threonine protein phosphatase PrpC